MGTTNEKQTSVLANYLPSGSAFGAKGVAGSRTRLFLSGLAGEMVRACDLIQEFRDEFLPDTTTLLIDEWESAVGIPDTCFANDGTLAERRTNVKIKLAALGLQTASEFEALAALLGITVNIVAGSVHGTFPFTFPIIFFPDARAARHTIIVDADFGAMTSFPYTFPITFEEGGETLLSCLYEKLKPANVDLLFFNLP